jgi:hypothetical protein
MCVFEIIRIFSLYIFIIIFRQTSTIYTDTYINQLLKIYPRSHRTLFFQVSRVKISCNFVFVVAKYCDL